MESQPALAVVQCGDRRAGLEALVPGLDGSVALDRRFLAGAAALAEVLPPDVRDPCVGCATGVGPASLERFGPQAVKYFSPGDNIRRHPLDEFYPRQQSHRVRDDRTD